VSSLSCGGGGGRPAAVVAREKAAVATSALLFTSIISATAREPRANREQNEVSTMDQSKRQVKSQSSSKIVPYSCWPGRRRRPVVLLRLLLPHAPLPPPSPLCEILISPRFAAHCDNILQLVVFFIQKILRIDADLSPRLCHPSVC
jgi:hypothetical protein